MIDLKNQTITVPGRRPEPIIRWTVWFVTVEGLHPVLSDAIESAERIGQPVQTIVPVAVACGQTGYEVSLRTGYAEPQENAQSSETEAQDSRDSV